MIESLTETIATLAPVVFPLVIFSQIILGALGQLFKLFNRPTIKFYPAGMIELGVDTLGPTITLFGTMQAQRSDFFITKIEANVQHKEGRTVDIFEWRAFKPYIFGFGVEEDVKYELVSAFALKTGEPFKYNIVFMDDSFIEKVSEQAREIIDAWKVFQTQTNENHSIGTEKKMEQLELFYQQTQVQAIDQMWRQRINWVAGHYQLTVRVYGSKYKANYPYQFELSEEQADTLRNNVKQIIFALCDERVSYSKAYVPYLEDK